MFFKQLSLQGAFLITPELKSDERGFLARTFCKESFHKQGLIHEFVQCNISYNAKKGTLRGLHYQVPPHEETKLIRCTRGAISDVIVDIRDNSSTKGHWLAHELNETNRHMLYVPGGFAHGFLTLVDDVEVFYHMSTSFHPESARTMPWNHKALNIDWPSNPVVISETDRNATDDPIGGKRQ